MPAAPRVLGRRAASVSVRLPRAAAALALLTALALGTPARAAEGCTASGGAPWRELRSQHFVIDVAGEAADPAHVVAVFEELHEAVLATLIAEPVEIPVRVRVVLLPRRRDLAEYTGTSEVLGVFWVTALGQPTILTSVDQLDDLPQVVAHELTHHLSSYLFPRQPFWFAEGLAQFVEGVAKVDGDGRRWGGLDPIGGWVAGSMKLPRMHTVVGGGAGEIGTSAYLTSWLLYRYLWNERGPQLSTYQQLLMEGVAPDDAWDRAFPEWTFVEGKINLLDDKITRYQLSGRGVRWPVKLGAVDARFQPAPASPGDVHATLLDLRVLGANPLVHGRLREQAMSEAEREDPGNPLVRAELASARGAPRLPALREALQGRPQDGRGWYLLALETEAAEEKEAALRQAVAHWPDGALAHAALASHLAGTARAREALRFANRAVELAPWSPRCVSTLATVAAALSKCKEALVLQTRAVEAVESRRVGSLDLELSTARAGLSTLSKRCAAPAAP